MKTATVEGRLRLPAMVGAVLKHRAEEEKLSLDEYLTGILCFFAGYEATEETRLIAASKLLACGPDEGGEK